MYGIYILVLLNGIFMPIYSAIFGAAWMISRIVYSVGYIGKGPAGRMLGTRIGLYLGFLPHVIMIIYNCQKLLRS